MSTAAARRRRSLGRAAPAIGTGLAVLLAVLLAPSGASAQPCPILEPDCQTTTTTIEATTTTEEEATTTTEAVDEEPPDTVTTVRARDTSRDEVVDTTTATVTATTLHDVLVPGDGTEGAESTTTTATRLASDEGGLSDETLILLIVGALSAVALVTGVLTWRYWDASRPPVGRRSSPGRGPGGRPPDAE